MRGGPGMARLGFGLLLAIASGGAEPPAPAPLSESKKALQELQKDQSAQGAAAEGKLRDLLPAIETPGAIPLPTAPIRSPKATDELKKKERKANWLLNGMEKLENKPERSANTRRGEKSNELDEPAGDDPERTNDLLGLYSEQQNRQKPSNQAAPRPGPNPMAPFLQNWLAGSAGRPAPSFIDALTQSASSPGKEGELPASARGPDSPAPVVLADLPGFPSGNEPPSLSRESRPNNPYLQALEVPIAHASAADIMPASLDRIEPPPQPVFAPILPPPASDKKSPVTPPVEDRKYFPQLKKF